MTIAPNFRPATQADASAIAQVYLRSRQQFLPFAPIVHSDEAVHQWIRDVLIPMRQVTVVEQDHQIVGMMALAIDEGIDWINQLYLQNYPSRNIRILDLY